MADVLQEEGFDVQEHSPLREATAAACTEEQETLHKWNKLSTANDPSAPESSRKLFEAGEPIEVEDF